MTIANAHTLYLGLKRTESYHAAINLRDSDEVMLKSARRKIRTCLREAFSNLRKWSKPNQLHKSLVEVESKIGSIPKRIGVRFLTQGSMAYRTIIAPAQTGQEIDLDDGCYFPMAFLAAEEPIIVARGMFLVVETALRPLCQTEGWNLETNKQTCARVHISSRAHIDLPLYAIPEESFDSLEKSFTKSVGLDFRSAKNLNEVLAGSARRIRIDPHQVWLARRDGTWERSDPRTIQDWFEDNLQIFGPVLRRECRYIKGWRDWLWRSCGLSSIALMKCVVDTFKEFEGEPVDNRDDLLALKIAKRLPHQLAERILHPAPAFPEHCLEEWCSEERQKYVDAAWKLKGDLESALEATTDQNEVVGRLRSVYGARMPAISEVVTIAGLNSSASDMTEHVIEHEPDKVPMPEVKPSTSG